MLIQVPYGNHTPIVILAVTTRRRSGGNGLLWHFRRWTCDLLRYYISKAKRSTVYIELQGKITKHTLGLVERWGNGLETILDFILKREDFKKCM